MPGLAPVLLIALALSREAAVLFPLHTLYHLDQRQYRIQFGWRPTLALLQPAIFTQNQANNTPSDMTSLNPPFLPIFNIILPKISNYQPLQHRWYKKSKLFFGALFKTIEVCFFNKISFPSMKRAQSRNKSKVEKKGGAHKIFCIQWGQSGAFQSITGTQGACCTEKYRCPKLSPKMAAVAESTPCLAEQYKQINK